ncbi:MAG: sulfate transporter CysZ [Magnetococcales bacterium]|nr:sulfate transporter CysZ [Magnetococcales bacterium]
MLNKLILGGSYPVRGLLMLNKPGIRRFVIVPLSINTSLFAIGIHFFFGNLFAFVHWIDGYLPSWLHWLQWLLAPLLVLAVATTLFFSFSMMTNLIAAPFNSLLAEQVELQLTGRYPNSTPFTVATLLTRAVPLLGNELNKIVYSLLWLLPFLLIYLIPGLNLAAPLLMLLYSAWMLAIQYLDLPMGNRDLSGREVRRRLRQQRSLAIGFGGMTLLLTTVPIVNFLAMPAAVVGATLLWVERFAEQEKLLNGGA